MQNRAASPGIRPRRFLCCILNLTDGVSPLRVAEMTGRVRRALWLVLAMLALSLVLVTLGIYATTRAENLSVSGYGSGVIVSCDCWVIFL